MPSHARLAGRLVRRSIRGRVHSYDLIIRLGSDGFLCGAMTDTTPSDMRERFDVIASRAESQLTIDGRAGSTS